MRMLQVRGRTSKKLQKWGKTYFFVHGQGVLWFSKDLKQDCLTTEEILGAVNLEIGRTEC